jgi:hypothetical protein
VSYVLKHASRFFDFCKERESIRVKKESGEPWPWTADPALQSAFYCNIYREDDKTTRWFKREVRDLVKGDLFRSLGACVAFRWFNKIETGEVIKGLLLNALPEFIDQWEHDMLVTLRRMRAEGATVFSGAYIISSPMGDPKIEWAVKCAAATIRNAESIIARCDSLELAWDAFKEEMGLGPFMSYEIVTDLRHTQLLDRAPDIMTWANPGPGCARGLGWIVGDYNRIFSRGSSVDRDAMLRLMRELLELSRAEPWITRPWEMREVEHSLCEFDKYRRVQTGGTSKRRYHP